MCVEIHDAQKNAAARQKVQTDKKREASDGHDGTWVAHPGLVHIAREIFDSAIKEDHQIHKSPSVHIDQKMLIEVPTGDKTLAGLKDNLRIGATYLAHWLSGRGCVAIDNLMEDAATAEISRAQIWQWIKHNARLDDGRRVDRVLFDQCLKEEVDVLRNASNQTVGMKDYLEHAIKLFSNLTTADELGNFLTIPAYELIVEKDFH